MRDYLALAEQYVADVLESRITTCKWTQLACKRQRDDLVREDFAYRFDRRAAENVCAFMEILTHVKGDLGGKNLVLEPWECFVLTTLFGWLRKDTGKRRFRRGFLSCGKGNGKSILSSGLCLYMLCGTGEMGADVVTAGSTLPQARLVFDVARDQLRANPRMVHMFGLKVLNNSIIHEPTTSTMRPVSSKGSSLAGILPNYCSADETWAYRNRSLLEELERAIDKRLNSLLMTITHAGADLSSVGYEQHENACAVLSGTLPDEKSFAIVYNPEGYVWTTREAWAAANPNLGVSVYEDSLGDACHRAQVVTSQQEAFRCKNLNEWLSADSSWIDIEKLRLCQDKTLHMKDFKLWTEAEYQGYGTTPRRFVMGVDLASRSDLASVSLICTKQVEGVTHYFHFGRYYIPEETLANSPVAQLKGWAARGLLIKHPGPCLNIQRIQDDIIAMKKDGWKITAAAYDEWQAEQTAGNVTEEGGYPTDMIKFGKTAKNYSPTMDFFQSLVLEKRFHFGDDPVLLWALSNVVCHRDVNQNLFPRKTKDNNRKIDPAISLLFALRCAMVSEGEYVKPVASFFRGGGILTVECAAPNCNEIPKNAGRFCEKHAGAQR